MTIGYDAKRLFTNYTGLGNYSRTLLRNLAHHYPEHSYTLYTPRINQSAETLPFLNNSTYRVVQPSGGVKSLWRSYGVADRFASDELDLYHGLSHEIPFKVHRAGIKTVVTIHDLIFKAYPETYPFFDRQIYDFKFRYACEEADRVIAISEHTKRDIIKYYGISAEKIDVVYQSIAPLFFEPKDPGHDQETIQRLNLPQEFLLYVGSIQERKCVDLIIQAYEILQPSERIPLIIVGSGSAYEQRMMEHVAAAGLNDLVIRLSGLSDNRDLKSLYGQASALVYPSKYEGFGLPVTEALLCQTPAITTTASSLPEAGGPDSLYITPDDAEGLAEAIRQVLQDTDLRQRMVEKGEAYALQHFGAQETSQRMLEVYQQVIAQ
ncbi:MAG: glycosyltransferase family 1 protein [Bacteroidota bacterium]